MKLVFPEIDFIFDSECGKINTLVIENASLFTSFLRDIAGQLNGFCGKAVLSECNRELQISKNLILLDGFVPFELNTKTLLSKINLDLEKKAISEEFYTQTAEVLTAFEKYLSELAFDYNCEIDFAKTDIGSFIKAAGAEIRSSSDSLAERLLDFFALTTEFVGRRFFVTVNLRCYLSFCETELFMKTALMHGYEILMLEGFEHPRTSFENRLVVDEDLCLIN